MARAKPAPAKAAPQSSGIASPATVNTATADTPDTAALADADLAAPPPISVPEAAQPAAPVAVASPPDSVQRPVGVPDEAIAGAVVGVLGLGFAGFVATRRRRKDEVVDDDPYETEKQSVDDEPVTSIPAELEVPSEQPAAAYAPVTATTAPAPAMSSSGPVPTGEARQQLLDEMVAATPDTANPFTSRPARRKRARIILQAREHRQRQQGDQSFDWRTYQPSADLDPADPPLVDA